MVNCRMHATAIDAGHYCLLPLEDGDPGEFAAALRESVDTVGRWIHGVHPDYGAREAQAWFDACRLGREAGVLQQFGIHARGEPRLLGAAGLNQIDPHNAVCVMSYWVRQSAQGRGAASAAIVALARHGFSTLGLGRVELVVGVGNEVSVRAARRAGAVHEGMARNRLRHGGRWIDAHVFSLVPPSSA